MTDPPAGETELARLIREQMAVQRLSYGDIETRGGPTKQAVQHLVKRWTGRRSPADDTLSRLAKALGVSERSVREAVAVTMNYQRPAEDTDALSRLVDVLRTDASDEERQLVVEVATATWRVLLAHRDDHLVVYGHKGVGKSSLSRADLKAEQSLAQLRAARRGLSAGQALRAQQDADAESADSDT